MRKIAWLIGVGSAIAAGAYTVVSLNRWEWNRALFFGLTFVMAEVAISTALVLRRLGQVAVEGAPRRSPPDPRVVARLRDSRPRSNRFEWLDPVVGRTNVFITMLVGGGVLLSGLAWLVDKIASRTTVPANEVRLARQLGSISYPRGGLLVDDVTVLAHSIPHMDDPQIRTLLRRAPREA